MELRARIELNQRTGIAESFIENFYRPWASLRLSAPLRKEAPVQVLDIVRHAACHCREVRSYRQFLEEHIERAVYRTPPLHISSVAALVDLSASLNITAVTKLDMITAMFRGLPKLSSHKSGRTVEIVDPVALYRLYSAARTVVNGVNTRDHNDRENMNAALELRTLILESLKAGQYSICT